MKTNERMRKALSVLLCVLMLVQYVPTTAFAVTTDDTLCEHTSFNENGACTSCGTQAVAKVGSTFYTAFDEALTAWAGGGTLTLLDDVTHGSEIILGGDNEWVLDLNGKTLVGSRYAIGLGLQSSSAKLTVKNGYLQGRITAYPGTETLNLVDVHINSSNDTALFIFDSIAVSITGGSLTSGSSSAMLTDSPVDVYGTTQFNSHDTNISISSSAGSVTFHTAPTQILSLAGSDPIREIPIIFAGEGVDLSADMFISNEPSCVPAEDENGAILLTKCDHNGGLKYVYSSVGSHRITCSICHVENDIYAPYADHSISDGVCENCNARVIYVDLSVPREYYGSLNGEEGESWSIYSANDPDNSYLCYTVIPGDYTGTVSWSYTRPYSGYTYASEATSIPADKDCLRLLEKDYGDTAYPVIWHNYPCAHNYDSATGFCSNCMLECDHDWDEAYVCTKCRYACPHSDYDDYHVCYDCEYQLAHNLDEYGECRDCYGSCDHPSLDEQEVCELCGMHKIYLFASEDFDLEYPYIRGNDSYYYYDMESEDDEVYGTFYTGFLPVVDEEFYIQVSYYYCSENFTYDGTYNAIRLIGYNDDDEITLRMFNHPHGHSYDDGFCTVCGIAHDHAAADWKDGKCAICGIAHNHAAADWKDGKCAVCGAACDHEDETFRYTIQAEEHTAFYPCGGTVAKAHSFSEGKCVCGMVKDPTLSENISSFATALTLTEVNGVKYYNIHNREAVAYTGTLTVSGSLMNTNTSNFCKTLLVDSGNHNIVLDGATISIGSNIDTSAIAVSENAAADLTLKGSSTLSGALGINIAAGGSVTIGGQGSLTTDKFFGDGSLTVEGGTVSVQGFSGATNIEIGSVTITGGSVTCGYMQGEITVTGGTVNADFILAADLATQLAGTFTVSGDAEVTAELIFCGQLAADDSATVNGLVAISIVDEDAQLTSASYTAYGNVVVSYDLTVETTEGSTITFTVPADTSLTINEGVTLDLSALAVKDIDLSGEIINNGTLILPAGFDLTAVNYSGTGTVTIDYGICMAGIRVNSVNAADVLDDGTVSYDADTNTLTLNGASIDVSNFAVRIPALKIEKGDVTLILLGSNTLAGSEGYPAIWIEEGASLTVSENSTGSMNVNGRYISSFSQNQMYAHSAIAGGGDLTVDGGTITGGGIRMDRDLLITGGTVEVDFLAGSNVTITGGTVTGRGNAGIAYYDENAPIGTYGIYADNDLLITGGTVTATGGYANIAEALDLHRISKATATAAMYAGNNITVSGGTVTATGGKWNNFAPDATGLMVHVGNSAEDADSKDGNSALENVIACYGKALEAPGFTISENATFTCGSETSHSYLEATCTKLSTCEFCGTSYGGYAEHKMVYTASETNNSITYACSYGCGTDTVTFTLQIPTGATYADSPMAVPNSDCSDKSYTGEFPVITIGGKSYQEWMSNPVAGTFEVKMTWGEQTVSGTYIVAKADPSYTVPTGLTATYGDLLSSVALEDGFTWENGNQPVGDAGSNTFTVTFTPKDTDNYNVVNGISVTVNVAKKQLVISGMSWTVPEGVDYDGAEHSATLNGTLPEGVTATKTGDSATNAGSYTAKAEFTLADGYSADNYEIANGEDLTADWMISKKDIAGAEITLGTALTYKGTEQTQTVASVKIDGLTVTYDVFDNKATNVGAYELTVSGNGNFTGTETAEWNIGKADVSIVWGSGYYNTYGANMYITAYINGVDGKMVTGTAVATVYDAQGNYLNSVTCTKTEASGTYFYNNLNKLSNGTYLAPGTYTVRLSFQGSDNYLAKTVDLVDYTINKQTLTVTANGNTITYGEAPANGGVTYSGFVGVEDESVLSGELTYSYDYEQYGNVGAYKITPSGLTSDNYEIEYVDGILTVNAKEIIVIAKAAEKTYGDADPELTYTVNGLLNEDKLTGSLIRTSGENVGTYDIAQGTLGSENYVISYTGAKLTINKRDVTISAKDQTILYGSTISSTEITAPGLVDGHSVTATLTSSTTNVTVDGTITAEDAKITDANGNDVTANYNISYGETATLVIKPDTSKIDGLTAKNVTSANKKDIKAVQAMIATGDAAAKENWADLNAACDALLEKIKAVAAQIAALTDRADDFGKETVNSTDKDELEQLAQDIEDLLDTQNLTKNERTALEGAKKDAEDLIDAIEAAQDATDTENTETVEDVTADNVKPEDKKALEDAKADLEKALEDNAGNYTEEEKQAIQDELQRIEDAIEALENVGDVTETVKALPETVEPDDEETAEKILDAKNAYDKLTDHEKSLVDETTKEKLDDLVAALTAYDIIEGDDGTWTMGSSSGLSFTANGLFSKFVGIEVDSKDVAKANYDAKSGSTVITFKASYLDTLSVGEHTITVIYTDGQTDGTFKIAARSVDLATGDNSNIMLYGSIIIIGLAALVVLLLASKKRKQKNA